MKKLILGFAIAATCFACASNDSTQVEDGSSAAVPASDCCAEKSECSDADAAECAVKGECPKAEASECAGKAKSECSAEAASECSKGQKTCPVTGQVISG
ncbi:MAG: hypothetical protein QF903_05395 [Planctomycetota bacterium]|jgi:hypothetical protein|nr:hypothetical protein [Planctomycetota bacterium]MDP6761847.1 hypothetical protein [Planctomycetota bacterium]MDP6988893.1 hypothetical protein [Planctomycetota bacterium]